MVLTTSRFQGIQTPNEEQVQESLNSVTQNQVTSTLGFHIVFPPYPGTIPAAAVWPSKAKDVNLTFRDDGAYILPSMIVLASEILLAHMVSQANVTLIMLIKVRLASQLLFLIE